MFATFLIGTALIVGLVMLVLLVQPRQTQARADRLPYVGMAFAAIFAALALIGGLAVSA